MKVSGFQRKRQSADKSYTLRGSKPDLWLTLTTPARMIFKLLRVLVTFFLSSEAKHSLSCCPSFCPSVVLSLPAHGSGHQTQGRVPRFGWCHDVTRLTPPDPAASLFPSSLLLNGRSTKSILSEGTFVEGTWLLPHGGQPWLQYISFQVKRKKDGTKTVGHFCQPRHKYFLHFSIYFLDR